MPRKVKESKAKKDDEDVVMPELNRRRSARLAEVEPKPTKAKTEGDEESSGSKKATPKRKAAKRASKEMSKSMEAEEIDDVAEQRKEEKTAEEEHRDEIESAKKPRIEEKLSEEKPEEETALNYDEQNQLIIDSSGDNKEIEILNNKIEEKAAEESNNEELTAQNHINNVVNETAAENVAS